MLVSSLVWANSIGTITALQGNASIVRDGVTIEALLGAKLNKKDNITTQDKSKMQIIFNDETIITIGKNSHFSINEYLFEENKTPQAKFSLISGAMRAITGKIGKIAPEKFTVETKTATIGIRGTNFSVLAGPDGSTQVFCTFGAITASMNGETVTVPQGFYVSVSADGKIGTLVKFTPAELNKMKADSFTDNKKDKVAKDNGTKEVTNNLRDANSEEAGIKTENIGLIIKDVTDKLTESTQQKTIDAAIAASTIFDISGYAIGYYSYLSNPSSINVLTSSTFDTSLLETDYWTFKLSPVMTFPVTTSGEFIGSFASAISSDYYVTDIQIVNSTFKGTKDLSVSDDMYWGSWSASVVYDYDGPVSENFSGLWVAGKPTANSVIDAYTNNSMGATYTGVYKAIDFQNNNAIVNGTATLEVDFGQSAAMFSLTSGNFSGETTNIYGNIASNQIVGSSTSSFNGTFYGIDGKSIGGNFIINDGSTLEAEGVYQVKTTDIHAGGNINMGQ